MLRTDSTLSLRRSLGKRVIDLVNHPYVTFKNTDCMAELMGLADQSVQFVLTDIPYGV